MRLVSLAALLLSMGLAVTSGPDDARAHVVIKVDISSKRMHVTVNRKETYAWNVATGPGRMTRPGTFGVQSLDADHYSSKYANEPMPHSIFYDGNRAIHGTTKTLAGHRTHGCIALSRENAKTLFRLVSRRGETTRIIVEP